MSTNAAPDTLREDNFLMQSLYDSDGISYNFDEQGYGSIIAESVIDFRLPWDAAEESIAQAQAQYVTLQGSTNWEMQSTYMDIIQAMEEVGSDPVIYHALATLPIWERRKEF